jgi:hypothetical protein
MNWPEFTYFVSFSRAPPAQRNQSTAVLTSSYGNRFIARNQNGPQIFEVLDPFSPHLKNAVWSPPARLPNEIWQMNELGRACVI